MLVRKPAVAGQFYPSDPGELAELIDGCYTHRLGPGKRPPAPPTSKTVAVVAPHAGYVYSGPVAAHSYYHASSLPDPDNKVIEAPNHYALAIEVSTLKKGTSDTTL